MLRSRWIPPAVLALLLTAAATAWMRQTAAEPPEQAPPTSAQSVRGLLFAEPFRLAEPYAHSWRAERPAVNAGWLLVLEVDPDVVVPRQLAEPVLVVGGQTAERVNQGDVSGRLVVIVPAAFDARRGLPDLDPSSAKAWFAEPALPEQTDAAALAGAAKAADAAGVTALAEGPRTRPGAVSDRLVELPGRTALERRAAELIAVWSPAELELAQTLLAPLVK
jgi:hypothetical protein